MLPQMGKSFGGRHCAGPGTWLFSHALMASRRQCREAGLSQAHEAGRF